MSLLANALSTFQTLNKGSFGEFKRSLNNTPYGYTIITDRTGTAPTALVERFEVQTGNCSTSPDWANRANDREGSELSRSKDNWQGKSFWYGWSMFLPNDYINICPTKTAVGQFHQDAVPPAFMFQNSCGGLWISRNFGFTSHMKRLTSIENLRDRWRRIEVYTKWTKKHGFFNFYVNGT